VSREQHFGPFRLCIDSLPHENKSDLQEGQLVENPKRITELSAQAARVIYQHDVERSWLYSRGLARHIQANDLSDEFATRTVYLKGWAGLDTPERVRGALVILEDAGWLHRIECPSSPTGGRPSESWLVNPKVARHAK
jgi:hypothetical protein